MTSPNIFFILSNPGAIEIMRYLDRTRFSKYKDIQENLQSQQNQLNRLLHDLKAVLLIEKVESIFQTKALGYKLSPKGKRILQHLRILEQAILT